MFIKMRGFICTSLRSTETVLDERCGLYRTKTRANNIESRNETKMSLAPRKYVFEVNKFELKADYAATKTKYNLVI